MANDAPKLTLDLIFKIVLNACGPFGLGATFMGWVKPLVGLIIMGIGLAYVLWEFRFHIKTYVHASAKMSLLIFCLCGALVGAGCWLAIWRQEPKKIEVVSGNPPGKKQAGDVATPTPPSPMDEAHWEIIKVVVREFLASHSGQLPSTDWINKRLTEKGYGFQMTGTVKWETPPSGTKIELEESHIGGGKIGILNEDPNASIKLKRTDVSGSEAAIKNSPKKPEEKEKPPQNP